MDGKTLADVRTFPSYYTTNISLRVIQKLNQLKTVLDMPNILLIFFRQLKFCKYRIVRNIISESPHRFWPIRVTHRVMLPIELRYI